MNKTSFGRAWLGDTALFVLIGIYWAAILVSDFTIWPGRSPTILLALPLIAVSLTKPPEFVIGAALMAIVLDAIDMYVEHPMLVAWAVSFLALVAMGFLATLIALQRCQAAQKRQGLEARIKAVEQLRQPLTVVVGYTQVLCNRPDLPNSFVVPLERIYTAAKRLQKQIDQLLVESSGSSG